MEIVAACDAGADTMVALGLPRPSTLADLVSTMWAAQDRLTPVARHKLTIRDRMELDYVASATKVTGVTLKRKALPFPK